MPGSTSPVLGTLLLFVAAALLVPASAAGLGKRVPAAVMVTAAVRLALTGAHQLTAGTTVRTVAGIVGVGLAVLAWYAAFALEREDVRGREVLPVRRTGGAGPVGEQR